MERPWTFDCFHFEIYQYLPQVDWRNQIYEYIMWLLWTPPKRDDEDITLVLKSLKENPQILIYYKSDKLYRTNW